MTCIKKQEAHGPHRSPEKLWPFCSLPDFPLVIHNASPLYPTDHNLDILKSTLPHDPSMGTYVSAFLAQWFLRFSKIFPIYFYVKLWFPIMAPPFPRGSWFLQFRIYTTPECFHISFTFSGPVVLEKKIFKDYSYIFLYKNLIPHCGPALPPGVIIWTI